MYLGNYSCIVCEKDPVLWETAVQNVTSFIAEIDTKIRAESKKIKNLEKSVGDVRQDEEKILQDEENKFPGRFKRAAYIAYETVNTMKIEQAVRRNDILLFQGLKDYRKAVLDCKAGTENPEEFGEMIASSIKEQRKTLELKKGKREEDPLQGGLILTFSIC